MEFRNASYNVFGTIDCEIEHPFYGWIPFTADPDDVDPLGTGVFDAAKSKAKAYIVPPSDPAAQLAAEQAEAEAKLHETDWVVVRAMEKYLIEQGITKDLPADVMAERGTARVKADKTPETKPKPGKK